MARGRKKIRLGVSGLGRIGWSYHCPRIAEHRDLELVAVQDPLEERRKEAVTTYGCKAYADFSEMLREGDLDAVAIASPTHLHRPMALEAFRAGCDVMMEKPMAPTAADAAAIVAAARRAERILTVYQPRRAAAWFQHLRLLLERGVIGEPYHYRLSMYQLSIRNDWQSLRKYGGGMLNNYGAHGLDQLLQLVGYRIKRVWSSLRIVASLGDAEDVVKVLLETPEGVVAELDINQAATIRPHDLVIWGSRGALVLAPDGESFEIRSFGPGAAAGRTLDRALASAGRRYPDGDIPIRTTTIRVDKGREVDVYADFAAAVRGRVPAFVKPEEPLAVMRLIERCRKDAGRILRTTAWNR